MGTTETVQRIREIHKQISPRIFFLMETKNPDEFVLTELEFLDQYEHFLVPPERPASGGLALFRKKDLNLKVLSANKNVITEVIHKGIFFYGSFIYGEPDVTKTLHCLESTSAYFG